MFRRSDLKSIVATLRGGIHRNVLAPLSCISFTLNAALLFWPTAYCKFVASQPAKTGSLVSPLVGSALFDGVVHPETDISANAVAYFFM